jgi:NADPH-dependent methylglyoxal reductase
MATGTVLITGASGFVGGNVLRLALERGWNVRATARSDSSVQKIKDQFPQYAAQLSFAIVPDMTMTDSYSTAFDGVTGLIHLASPFVLNAKDNVKDLLEPAVHGVTAVLEAANRWGTTLNRLILTSSHASVYNPFEGKRPGYTYDEKDWNPITWDQAATTDPVTAYAASKALAERTAWDFMKEKKPRFDLVTITPPWVFGPYATELRSTKHLSESLHLLYGILGAKDIPPFDFGGFADVREVALAHIRALEVSEAGGQRFWVGQNFNYQSAVDAVREELPELKERLPLGTPGQVEDTYKVDGSKATRILGVQYRSLAECMRDTYKDFLHAEEVEASA